MSRSGPEAPEVFTSVRAILASMTVRLGSVVLRSIATWAILPDRFRSPLLRRAGIEVADNVLLKSGTQYVKFGSVSIGAGSFVNHDCYFDAEATITIGRKVSVADHVRFVTATHDVGPVKQRAGPHFGLPIEIRDGTWVGSSVVILPGVSIGKGCVIAAGAVVTRDCEPNSLYAGVPARKVRKLDNDAGQ